MLPQPSADGLPIRTRRLVVRRFSCADWEGLYSYLSRPEVYRFEPGDPIDGDAARLLAAERARGVDFLALELAQTGRVVGHCSFVPSGAPDAATRSLGFIVHPEFQGQGLAAEGGRATAAWGFDVLGLHRVEAECDPANVASWRTLERIGFVREGHLRSNIFFRRDGDGAPRWQDTYVYGLLQADLRERT